VAGRSVPAQTRLQQLLDQVRESLRRHGDLELVESALADLLRTGTGADVQRAAHAARGSLRDVVADAVRRAVPGAYSMLPES
jgi:carboxylate-amine ligase